MIIPCILPYINFEGNTIAMLLAIGEHGIPKKEYHSPEL